MKGIFEKKELRLFARMFNGFRSYPPMFHSHVELLYVCSGSVCMTVDGCEYTLLPGQAGFVFPYAVHSYAEVPDAKVIMLMFAPDAVSDFERRLLSCKPLSACIEDAESLLPAFEKVLFYAAEEAGMQQVALAYLNALVGEALLHCELSEVCDATQDVILRVLGYCNTHYVDEDISVRHVARATFVSESYVTKIFSARLGYSFRDYINSMRLQEAETLLRKTDMKITRIMGRCGFKNQSSFNRVFLQNYGCTPREYRVKCGK